jgi:hypothetical protein
MLSSAPNAFTEDADSYLGRLICAGKGYLLEMPGGNGPVCGLRFYKPNFAYGSVRAFRVVFPKNLPYAPHEGGLDLCNLAKNGKADPEEFATFASKLPSRSEDGRLYLPFGGDLAIVTSVKNFIVADQNGNQVFVIYKAAPGACTVKFRVPITTVQAFAIAIACIIPENRV